MASLETTLVTALNEGSIDLGAPVLEATVISSVGDTYEPVASVEVVVEEEEEDEEEEEEVS